MCNSVNFEGRTFNTPGELASIIGGADKLIWQTKNPFARWPVDKDWRVLDMCLCPINLAETLKRASLIWMRSEADPMEWLAWQKPIEAKDLDSGAND